MRLIRALRDCKQRSSTVSKKAPTVSRKASPHAIAIAKILAISVRLGQPMHTQVQQEAPK